MYRLYTYLCDIHAQPSQVHITNKMVSIKRFLDDKTSLKNVRYSTSSVAEQ